MFKVLVTGSSGFVGKNLVETLYLKKYLVYEAFYDKEKKLIDRLRRFNNKEIETLIDFENIKKIDCIIHCAAKVPNSLNKKNNLDEYRKANVELTLLTAKEAVKKGIKRFVYLSSLLSSNHRQTKKNSSKNFYSVSKFESEIALMEFSKQTGLEVVILRPPIIYGKYVKGNFLTLLNLIYKQIPLPLKNIKVLKSYVGIENLIDLIIVCMKHPKAAGKIFPVSDGFDIEINNLVIKISKYMKKSPKLFYLPLPLIELLGYFLNKTDQLRSIIEPLKIDNVNLDKVLGWRPILSLDEGLKNTVHWYLKNR
jgi:nucleoside-diphosphate-sugar epimerase